MQTSYTMHPSQAVHGMTEGPRESRPMMLPWLEQIDSFAIADAEAGTLSVVITDVETEQTVEFDVTISSTDEPTSLDEIAAAFASDPTALALFSVTEDGVDTFVTTARHANREYTFAFTPPGSMTVTPTAVQAAGGAKVDFGFVAGNSDNEIVAIDATTELADLVGVLRRTDANHWRETYRDEVEALARGRKWPVNQECRVWLTYAGTAPTVGGDLYLRRAQTSSSGVVGELLAAPAGGQAVYFVTPTAVDLPGYGVEFGWRGRHYTGIYHGDGSTTVAVAVDGLVFDLGTIAGLTIADATTHMSITTAAGEDLDYIRPLAAHTDVPAASVAVSTSVAADIDAIDISSVAKVETVLPNLSLALVRIHIEP